jgi:hypothetical protein
LRVSIDVDRKCDAMSVLLRGMKRIGKAPDEIRVSARGNGFHFIWLNACGSFEESVELRKFIGDDTKRVWIDVQSECKPRQILWNSKTYSATSDKAGQHYEAKTITITDFMELMR